MAYQQYLPFVIRIPPSFHLAIFKIHQVYSLALTGLFLFGFKRDLLEQNYFVSKAGGGVKGFHHKQEVMSYSFVVLSFFSILPFGWSHLPDYLTEAFWPALCNACFFNCNSTHSWFSNMSFILDAICFKYRKKSKI